MWIGGLFNAMNRLARALEEAAGMLERLNADAAARMATHDTPALTNGHDVDDIPVIEAPKNGRKVAR